MGFLRQIEGNARTRGPRTWVTVWACLLLILFGSTVQAVHMHGSPLKAAKAQVSADVSGSHTLAEELCPLCAAMHGASVAPTVPVLQLAVQESAATVVAREFVPMRAWSFELFSRPPPVSL